MVCESPNIIYIRRFYPIDGNKSEQELKKLNKPRFGMKKNPITGKQEPWSPGQNWIPIEVPCGKCDNCRIDKANDFATRCTNEAEYWDFKGIFITLTYNNKNLPFNKDGKMTLKRKDIQDFKKRLRKFASKHKLPFKEWINPQTDKKERPIRTFEAGEYGPTFGRPHYHMCCYNWEPSDLKFWKIEDGNTYYKSKSLQKIWGKGFIVIGKITYESASYTARYTQKKLGIAQTHREYYETIEYNEEAGAALPKIKYRIVKGEVEPEFISMSTCPGIGKIWFLENKQKIIRDMGIMLKAKNGVKLKRVPRYYKKIWKEQNWQEYEQFKYNLQKKYEEKEKELIKKYNLPEEWSPWQKTSFIRNKQLESYKARTQKLKRERIEH